MERRRFESIDSVQSAFAAERYVADRDLATAVYLSLALDRPLLLEGEAGVGKTEVGRTLAAVLKTELIRLQCYEGLDVNTAVYEWDYPRQMLEIRLLEARGEAKQAAAKDIFSEEFLIRRPLLRALENSRPEPPVLLIDEVDRADEEFEAYLLEVLADFAITIPEVGTIRADRPPHVIITSNRTREVHDALKRRCLYHWIDYPSSERELAILGARAFLLPQTRQVTRGTAHRGAAAPEQIEGRVVQGALFPPPHEHRSSRRLHVAAAIEAEEGEHVGEAAGLIRIDGQTGASERPPEQHHVAD